MCHGARYNRETLEVHFKGKTIADVLDMPIEEAADFFAAVPAIARHLRTLERRRPRLRAARPAGPDPVRRRGAARQARHRAAEAVAPGAPSTCSTSRPRACTSRTSASCSACCRAWSTRATPCIVIEHNLDVIKSADWLIDLGPEGGSGGGRVIAEGTPEHVATLEHSHTGRFLAPVLAKTARTTTRATGTTATATRRKAPATKSATTKTATTKTATTTKVATSRKTTAASTKRPHEPQGTAAAPRKTAAAAPRTTAARTSAAKRAAS